MRFLLSIVILLFFAAPSFAQQVVVVKKKAAGATAFCTGSATCTSTNPDQCDLICEDMEGASSCASGYDSACRNTWTAAVGSGDSIDFTTNHVGTFPCTDKGSNAATLTITDASRNTNINKNFGVEKTDVFLTAYFAVTSDGSTTTKYNRIIFAYNNSSGDAFTFGYFNSGGTLIFQTAFRNNAAGYTTKQFTKTLSLNTWYRARISFASTTGNYSAEVADANGANSETQSATTLGNDRLVRTLYFGTYSTTQASAFTFQVDNIAVDDDTLPGGCNQ